MNAMILRDMSDKVKRGHIAKAKRGEQPAGIAYGYKTSYEIDDNGIIGKKIRVIDPEKAKVVKYIFEEYVKGIKIPQIAVNLNIMKIPSPSGILWKSNSISGSKERNEGIINNPIYKGLVVYNITSKLTNPINNKTINVINPIKDRIETPNEAFRIISDELWNAAKTEQLKRSFKKKTKKYNEHRANPLTNLVYCGACGGRKTIANNKRYVCNNYRYKRTCKNARGAKEHIIFITLIEKLMVSLSSIKSWEDHFTIQLLDDMALKEDMINQKNKLKEDLETYLDAIRDKVSGAKDRAYECEYEISEIEKRIGRMRDFPKDYENMHELLIAVVSKIKSSFLDDYYDKLISILLLSIVNKITLKPKTSRNGEDIEIILKNNWVDFYYQAKKIGFID